MPHRGQAHRPGSARPNEETTAAPATPPQKEFNGSRQRRRHCLGVCPNNARPVGWRHFGQPQQRRVGRAVNGRLATGLQLAIQIPVASPRPFSVGRDHPGPDPGATGQTAAPTSLASRNATHMASSPWRGGGRKRHGTGRLPACGDAQSAMGTSRRTTLHVGPDSFAEIHAAAARPPHPSADTPARRPEKSVSVSGRRAVVRIGPPSARRSAARIRAARRRARPIAACGRMGREDNSVRQVDGPVRLRKKYSRSGRCRRTDPLARAWTGRCTTSGEVRRHVAVYPLDSLLLVARRLVGSVSFTLRVSADLVPRRRGRPRLHGLQPMSAWRNRDRRRHRKSVKRYSSMAELQSPAARSSAFSVIMVSMPMPAADEYRTSPGAVPSPSERRVGILMRHSGRSPHERETNVSGLRQIAVAQRHLPLMVAAGEILTVSRERRHRTLRT